jgi:ABC-2 type transport system permease protein
VSMAAIELIKTPQTLARGGWRSDWRALGVVVWREGAIFLRYPSWVVSMLIWPVILPAAYILSARALAGPDGSGLALFTQAAGTSNYVGYIAIGTLVWMWQNMSLWTIGFALREEQMRGTLESNWLTPAPRLWFLLGSGLLHGLLMVSFMIVAGLEFALFFGVHFAGNPVLIVLVLLAAMPSVYGLGFAFASLVMAAKEANAFVFLVRGLVMIFCGITYPISVLPGWMQSISAWLPQTYVIHGIRSAALTGAGLSELRPDLLALAGFGVLWLAAGYAAFLWMERRARQSGSLGQY